MRFNKILISRSKSCPFNSYYLTERGTDNGLIFGAAIENDENRDCAVGLFEDRREAELFVRLLLKNDVSPIHLFETADDYMGRLCFEQ